MKSYAKDISSGSDMTARAYGHGSSSSISSRPVDPMALPFYEEEDGPNVSKKSYFATPLVAAAAIEEQPQSLWCEAVTDEGHTYYWNVKTNGKKFCLF